MIDGKARILLIEDDPWVGDAVTESLRLEGHEVAHALTAEEGFFLASEEAFDLLIIDWMLPDHDGVSVIRMLRERGSQIPIIMLTARDASADKVKGLAAGADDYLPKPYDIDELHARVNALLRRSAGTLAQQLVLGDLVLDAASRHATRDDKDIGLTAREFDILLYLMRRKGQVVSRAGLARDVWERHSYDESLAATIDVHLTRLRKKLDHGQRTKLLHTIRGVGLVLQDSRPDE